MESPFGSLPRVVRLTTCLANLLHGFILAATRWLGSGALSHIPTPALAGVTAWMGLSLVDWSIWRRLVKMNLADASAYVATAASVLFVNAALSVVVGCSIYVLASGRCRGAAKRESD
jgi:SulP family sulfate permease